MLSIYIHIPFCLRRCNYCDFITYAGMQDWLPSYCEALQKEIDWFGKTQEKFSELAQTVYFGGGTPSLLSVSQVEAVLERIQTTFGIAADAEITLEANPGTISLEYLRDLRRLGINRLSLGIQSFSDAELTHLGRIHNREEAQESIRKARQAGFDNLSLDLIFGLPGQSLETWQQNLEEAISFKSEHLSLYNLIVEQGTPLEAQIEQKEVQPPDEDTAADMYEFTMEYLARKGYEQYEISSWAASPQMESRHNKAYWKMTPYLGFGAGAASFAAGKRTQNTSSIPVYIQRISEQKLALPFPLSAANSERNEIDRFTQMQEC